MAKLTSFDRVQRALGKMNEQIDKGKLDMLALSGAERMLEIVKSQCPVDSGELRDSLYIDTSNRESVRGQRGRQSHLAVQNLYCKISTNVYYAWFVEYGTSHAKAQPFMRPAFDVAARPVADSVMSAAADLMILAFAQAV